jgi:hypothetical protein
VKKQRDNPPVFPSRYLQRNDPVTGQTNQIDPDAVALLKIKHIK